MLSKNEPFNHEIYEQLTQKNFKSKDKKLNINNAIKFLESQGKRTCGLRQYSINITRFITCASISK